jgi:hypothetical protein
MISKTHVERNIYRRLSGSLYVSVKVGDKVVHQSCPTLSEARKVRDRLIAKHSQQVPPKPQTGKRWICTVLMNDGSKAKLEYGGKSASNAATLAANKTGVARVLFTEAANATLSHEEGGKEQL